MFVLFAGFIGFVLRAVCASPAVQWKCASKLIYCRRRRDAPKDSLRNCRNAGLQLQPAALIRRQTANGIKLFVRLPGFPLLNSLCDAFPRISPPSRPAAAHPE